LILRINLKTYKQSDIGNEINADKLAISNAMHLPVLYYTISQFDIQITLYEQIFKSFTVISLKFKSLNNVSQAVNHILCPKHLQEANSKNAILGFGLKISIITIQSFKMIVFVLILLLILLDVF